MVGIITVGGLVAAFVAISVTAAVAVVRLVREVGAPPVPPGDTS